jgi:hypothetical protein
MTEKATHYLNFSDEILESLLAIHHDSINKINSPNLRLIDNVINEYCTLIQEIHQEASPEYIELGTIALEILKTGMTIKAILERDQRIKLNVA